MIVLFVFNKSTESWVSLVTWLLLNMFELGLVLFSTPKEFSSNLGK